MNLKMSSATNPQFYSCVNVLTHWGRVTHICASKLSILGSNNGLSPGRCQAIIWTNAGMLLIWPFGTNISEILIEIHTFSFNKMYLKMSSAKWRSFCASSSMCFKPTAVTARDEPGGGGRSGGRSSGRSVGRSSGRSGGQSSRLSSRSRSVPHYTSGSKGHYRHLTANRTRSGAGDVEHET